MGSPAGSSDPTVELVLAFDFGLRHTGVAVGQHITGTARGVATLKCNHGVPDWRALKQLIANHGPQIALIGLPLNMDGTDSDMSQQARHFAATVEKKTGLRVALVDERLTSREAAAGLEEARASGQARTDHELAACFIAQSWLADQRRP